MNSIQRFLDAFDRFVSAVGSVGWTALALALGFHLLNLLLRTRAWRNIVASTAWRPREAATWSSSSCSTGG